MSYAGKSIQARIVLNELSTYSISVLKLPVDNRIYKNQEGLLLGEESSQGCWCPLGLNTVWLVSLLKGWA